MPQFNKFPPFLQQLPPIKTPSFNKYWFILGREPLLSQAELRAVFCERGELVRQQIYRLKNIDDNPKELINRLGGIIKIAEEVRLDLTKNELEKNIIEILKKIKGKIHFGISYYESTITLKDAQKFGLEIKKQIKNLGRSVRYVQNRELILSSAVVKNNKLDNKGIEFLITDAENKKYNLAVTAAVQPFAKFSRRDYGRPGRDDFSGLLPPKLAMMMLNLARIKLNDAILDPFCGSGTILSEALLMGYNHLTGSDASAKAVEDTKTNLNWLKNNFQFSLRQATNNLQPVDVKQCDVDIISSAVKPASIKAIITEPYLGRPLKGHETKERLISQALELKQLYINAFMEFKKILKKSGIVIFIIPCFKFKNDWITIDCLAEIKKLGFTLQPLLPKHDYLLYHRPGQFLGREIWRFMKI